MGDRVFVWGMIQLLICRLLSLIYYVISTGSDGAAPLDKSFVLEYLVVEELPAVTMIGTVPRDYQLNRKYSSATLDKLRFRFLSRPGIGDRQLFDVDETTGVLRTTERIDREVICPGLTDCFVAFDVAVHPMMYFQIIKVRVKIVDVNDNAPVFPQPSVTLELSEAAEIGATLPLPNAVDLDAGRNGNCEYHLSPADGHFRLRVTPTDTAGGPRNGGCAARLRLVLTEGLDRETVDQLRFSVVAVDFGQPVRRSGSLVIDLIVLDANDNPPTFDRLSYAVSVAENLPAGSPVFQLTAVDADLGPNSQVRYSFVGRTLAEHDDIFCLDVGTGVVSTRRSLDFEVSSFYRLFVAATDLGDVDGGVRLTSHTLVEVTVTDVNDHYPQICLHAQRHRSLEHGSKAAATTASKNSIASESMVSSSDCQNASSVTVVAELLDDGDSFVAHATVTDADSGDNGRFECRLNGSSAPYFALRRLYATEFVIVTTARSVSVSPLQTSLGRPDALGRRVIGDFVLVCRDHGDPTITSLANVRVEAFEENAHAPTFDRNLYHASVSENNEVGAVLTRVEATDDDVHGNRIHYRLSGDPSSASLLSIDASTGVVSAALPLDRELMSTVEATVLAVDSGYPPLTGTARIMITVRDVNDEQPTFQRKRYSFRVAENQPGGTVVGELLAVDRDTFPFNQIAYSIDPVSDKFFGLDHRTGRLVTRRPLDRETNASYRAVAIARSPLDDEDDIADTTAFISGSGTGVCDVDIVVDDVNDNRPRFEFPVASDDTLAMRAVDAGIGHVVGQVSASDRDSDINARLVYRLSTQSVSAPLPSSTTLTTDVFHIDPDSGTLTTTVDLRGTADDSSSTEFILEVVVSDLGTPPLSDSARLRVVVGSDVVGLRRTDVYGDVAAGSWEGGAVAELLALSAQEVALIVAFVISAILVSICVVVVCAARCDRKREQRRRSTCRKPEVAAIGDTSIDSPLMMTSLTSDSMLASDCQRKRADHASVADADDDDDDDDADGCYVAETSLTGRAGGDKRRRRTKRDDVTSFDHFRFRSGAPPTCSDDPASKTNALEMPWKMSSSQVSVSKEPTSVRSDHATYSSRTLDPTSWRKQVCEVRPSRSSTPRKCTYVQRLADDVDRGSSDDDDLKMAASVRVVDFQLPPMTADVIDEPVKRPCAAPPPPPPRSSGCCRCRWLRTASTTAASEHSRYCQGRQRRKTCGGGNEAATVGDVRGQGSNSGFPPPPPPPPLTASGTVDECCIHVGHFQSPDIAVSGLGSCGLYASHLHDDETGRCSAVANLGSVGCCLQGISEADESVDQTPKLLSGHKQVVAPRRPATSGTVTTYV